MTLRESFEGANFRGGYEGVSPVLQSYGVGGRNYEQPAPAHHPSPVANGYMHFDDPYVGLTNRSGHGEGYKQEARLGQNDAGGGRAGHDHWRHGHRHDHWRHGHGHDHLRNGHGHDHLRHGHGHDHLRHGHGHDRAGHRNWSHHRREHEHRHQPQEHGGGGHSGRISFYGGSTDSKWEGRRTASGRAFHGGENTIAVRPSDIASGKYHFGEHVKVCANGRCVPATVTDTGGFGKYNRIADVSHAIADQLHFTHSGTVHARIVKD